MKGVARIRLKDGAGKDAESEGDLRVVDESGEDYLFPARRFVAIDVPAAVKASLNRPAR